MKKILRDLWYNYLMEERGGISTEEEKRAIALLADTEEQLMVTMSDEQKAMLEKVQNCLDDVYAISIERAFEEGLVFSFEYLLALLKRE